MQIFKSYLLKIKKRKYISLSQAIIFQYIFMFGILLRPFPIIENVKIIDGTFWQIMYLLLPEITYYLLVIYSVLKIFELKNNLKHKNIIYALITPNILLALKLTPYTINNLCIFLNMVLIYINEA